LIVWITRSHRAFKLGEPLPDEYGLLIYAKNGHRPQLLEHLADAFPRHIQIHYGRYRRGAGAPQRID